MFSNNNNLKVLPQVTVQVKEITTELGIDLFSVSVGHYPLYKKSTKLSLD